MTEQVSVQDFIKTGKQKQFENDFFKKAENYVRWEDADDNGWIQGDIEFKVELEDILAFSEGVVDDNPLFNDVEIAKNGPFGDIIAHPIFLVQIIFWCAGDEGPGSWIKTPGAINPGQNIEFGVPIRPGDVIKNESRFYDKYIKRNKRYLSFQSRFFNQNNETVYTVRGALILPVSKGSDEHKFM